MSRLRVFTLVLLLAGVLAATVGSGGAAGAEPLGGRVGVGKEEDPEREVRKVLVLSLPRLRWKDVAEGQMPALERLLDRSAIANLSVRTIGPRTSLGEAYATLGAGNRTAAGEADSGLGLQRNESDFEGDGVAVYQRRMGGEPRGDVFQIAFPAIQITNERLLYGAEPGTLGTALREADLKTAVVGNSDAEGSRNRELVLGLMDDRGTVVNGRVDNGLNELDPESPFGTRSSFKSVENAFSSAWDESHVVLLEASDMERADRYGMRALPEAADRLAVEARESADRLIEMALERVDLKQDMVIVMSPASPVLEDESLTVFAMAGPGIEPGVAYSGTTRRPGYVTIPDIGPTILDRLGIEQPEAMTGTVMVSGSDSRSGTGLYRDFARANEFAIFRDHATGPVTVGFIVLQVLSYLLAVGAALSSASRRRKWRPIVSFMALMVLAFPSLAYLSGLVDYDRLGIAGYLVTLLAMAALAAGAARLVGVVVARRAPFVSQLVPPLLLVAVTWLVMVVDVVLLNGRLQIGTVFGYSPIVAGRFAGFGNQAFSLLTMATVVLASGIWSLRRLHDRQSGAEAGSRGRRDRVGLGIIALLFVLTIVVDGHPGFGSDVGGVLATVPAAAVLLLILAGIKVDLRRGALIAAGTFAVLAVFAAADLARPPESRTHLGRLVASTFNGGIGELFVVLQRKFNANLTILMSSIWTWIIPVTVGLIVFVTWKRKDLVREVDFEAPGLRSGLWGGIVLCLLGFALNDSGVAVPAMMLAVLLPYLTYLFLRVGQSESLRRGAPAAEAESTPESTPA